MCVLYHSQTPQGYISKDIISYPYIPKSPKKDIISCPYIPKSPKKDISYHFLEHDIFGIEYPYFSDMG
jgi:hypothetical protein